MSEPEVICARKGACGVITLNRPKALNALTLQMVRDIAAALDAWEADGAVCAVLVEGAGDRAFCAGGDVRQLYAMGKAGDFAGQKIFYSEEYALNLRISRYPKPYVALLDGIVMGGGAGLSLHGAHRVAGDRFSFAMPEVGIGFFPDVGATYFLPRLKGVAGRYLALTGARAAAADAVELGLATARVPSDRLTALRDRLHAGEAVGAAIAAEAVPPPTSPLAAALAPLAACFEEQTVAATLAALDRAAAAGSRFAAATAQAAREKSPTSLAIALRQMQVGADLALDAALKTEFRIVLRVARGEDFYEGVRATLVEKDGAPRWRPDRVEAVTPAMIDAYFAPLPDGELSLPGGSRG
jgi:enoyl-CoA hydratase